MGLLTAAVVSAVASAAVAAAVAAAAVAVAAIAAAAVAVAVDLQRLGESLLFCIQNPGGRYQSGTSPQYLATVELLPGCLNCWLDENGYGTPN